MLELGPGLSNFRLDYNPRNHNNYNIYNNLSNGIHMDKELIVGISGASGASIGIRILQALHELNITTHLVVSKTAYRIMELETEYTMEYVQGLATHVYDEYDFTAAIASGSYNRIGGMVIAPCSMRTLGSIANGISDNLMGRSAHVCLKEERKLVLVTRETPLDLISLENMVRAKKAGATIMPACPGFYTHQKSVGDVIDFLAGRALDILGVENELYARWGTGD